MEPPKLIEPGVSYFFNNILKSCHKTKIKYNNLVINLSLLYVFLTIIYVILKYRNVYKTTNEEKTIKERTKKEYILNKLSLFNNNKLKERQELITNYNFKQ